MLFHHPDVSSPDWDSYPHLPPSVVLREQVDSPPQVPMFLEQFPLLLFRSHLSTSNWYYTETCKNQSVENEPPIFRDLNYHTANQRSCISCHGQLWSGNCYFHTCSRLN